MMSFFLSFCFLPHFISFAALPLPTGIKELFGGSDLDLNTPLSFFFFLRNVCFNFAAKLPWSEDVYCTVKL